MKKADIIKSIIGHEFHFSDYGICGLRSDGVVVNWGEPCHVEHNGKWVIANLYKLPKVWAECCANSNYYYECYGPEDKEVYSRMLREELKMEFGI